MSLGDQGITSDKTDTQWFNQPTELSDKLEQAKLSYRSTVATAVPHLTPFSRES